MEVLNITQENITEIEIYPVERETLNALYNLEGKATPKEISKQAKIPLKKVLTAVYSLQNKNLVKVQEREITRIELTKEGLEYAVKGLPEYRLLKLLQKKMKISIRELLEKGIEGLEKKHVNLAIGHLRSRNWAKILKDKQVYIAITEEGKKVAEEGLPEQEILKFIRRRGQTTLEEIGKPLIIDELAKRKLLITKTETLRTVIITELGKKVVEGKIIIPETVKKLTRELIVTGKWKEVKLKKYDVTIEPPKIYPGKKHPYLEFLEEVRRALIGLGFQEAKGPYVELEFYNFDLLFQAQDHPAREIHDSYILKFPDKGEIRSKELVERVKATHENGWITGSKGWGYKWSFDIARRLILRSQTTAVSMRYLIEHKKPPIKMFCIDRVFRPDILDATHSMEFCQCEGIVVDKGLTLRHLLGALKEILQALGFKEFKFKPGYFPFTEPSVECFIKHPKLGWIEVAGSGLFRPEVLIPLDIPHPEVQVLAWGIGVERLAMTALGVNDIRYLRTHDLEWLREKEVL